MSKMEIGGEPCVWHKLSLKIDVHYVALSTSNGQQRKLDTRVGMNPGRGRSRVTSSLQPPIFALGPNEFLDGLGKIRERI